MVGCEKILGFHRSPTVYGYSTNHPICDKSTNKFYFCQPLCPQRTPIHRHKGFLQNWTFTKTNLYRERDITMQTNRK